MLQTQCCKEQPLKTLKLAFRSFTNAMSLFVKLTIHATKTLQSIQLLVSQM